MTDKYFGDKGFTYILIAAICVLIFFIGYQIMSNPNINIDMKIFKNFDMFSENENEIKDNEGNFEVVDSVISEEDISDDKNEEDKEILPPVENINTFYLKTIVNSNSSFDYFYEKDYVKEEGFFKRLLSKLNPKSYILSQIPAINLIGFNEDAENESGDNNSNDNKNVKVIEGADLVEEIDKDLPVFNDIDEDTNESKYEEIIFIDPYEGEEVDLPDEVSDINDKELAALASSIKKINVKEDKPYLLVYHTHTSESYLPASDDNFHVANKKYNVLSVGEIITNGLKEKGHNLIYVDKYHDQPYSSSYSSSRKTIESEMAKEKNIKILIDIHRDAGTLAYKNSLENNGFKQTVNIDGKDVATFSMVIGPDNKNKGALEELAKYVKKVSDQMYPGLCSRIIKKETGRFNMYYSDYTILLEVGSIFVTAEEAQNSAKLIVDVLDRAIDGIK